MKEKVERLLQIFDCMKKDYKEEGDMLLARDPDLRMLSEFQYGGEWAMRRAILHVLNVFSEELGVSE